MECLQVLHVNMDNGESPCLHVDTDMECLHVSMSPCGYGHGVSPCLHVDMDMECLHFCLHVDIDIRVSPYLHVDIDMECIHMSMSPFGYGT